MVHKRVNRGAVFVMLQAALLACDGTDALSDVRPTDGLGGAAVAISPVLPTTAAVATMGDVSMIEAHASAPFEALSQGPASCPESSFPAALAELNWRQASGRRNAVRDALPTARCTRLFRTPRQKIAESFHKRPSRRFPRVP